MTRTATERSFKGPYKESLSELAELITWLQTEHDKSFVKAGDDKVYAFGGDGFVLVLDERVWDGLIELITPGGALSISPGEGGQTTVTSAVEGEGAIKKLLKQGIQGIRTYYENRYWSTPKTAQP
ncbi:MAG TPA: hypothetical protein VKF81_10680 [Blastocatellia bacterium]|nr:hypothetical protein [Blastocatellia bacterium]